MFSNINEQISSQENMEALTTGGPKNVYAEFFGEPNGDINLYNSRYDGNRRNKHYENYDLPEAYRGKNKYLENTVTGLIMHENEWFTSVALPYQETRDIHFTWNTTHYDQKIAGIVPHEGIVRLVTSTKSEDRASTTRRGIGFNLEHDFMRTAEGKRQYLNNIRQIQKSVQTTNNFDVLATILNCKRYDREYERRNGQNAAPLRTVMAREVNEWAMVQKNEQSFEILGQEYVGMFKDRGIDPDVWIFPPKLQIYTAMVPPEKQYYFLYGPEGVLRQKQGPDALTRFRGVNVYETRKFDLYEGDLPIDMMTRTSECGEYYLMTDDFLGVHDDATSQMRDIEIYNEDKDNFERITFKAAVKNAKLEEVFYKGPRDKTDTESFNSTNVCTFGQLWKPDAVPREDEDKRFPALYDDEGLQRVVKTCKSAFVKNHNRSLGDFDDLAREKFSDFCVFLKTIFQYNTETFKKILNEHDDQDLISTLLNNLIPSGTGGDGAGDALDRQAAKEVLGQMISHEHFTASAAPGEHQVSFTNDHFQHAQNLPTNQVADFIQKCNQLRVDAPDEETKNAVENFVNASLSSNSNHFKQIKKLLTEQPIVYKKLKDQAIALSKEEASSSSTGSDVSIEHFAKRQKKNNSKSSGAAAGTVTHVNSYFTDVENEKVVTSNQHIPPAIHKAAYRWNADTLMAQGVMLEEIALKHNVSLQNIVETLEHPGAERQSNNSLFLIGAGAEYNEAYIGPINASDTSEHSYFTNVNTFIEEKTHGMEALIVYLFAGAHITTSVVTTMYDKNIYIPFHLMLARPRQRYAMSSAILMKGGKDTGATYIGHSDFLLGSDAQTKMLHGNFTYRSKAVIKNNRNVAIAENIFCQGYLGGTNTEFAQDWSDFFSPEPDFMHEYNGNYANIQSIIPIVISSIEKIKNNPVCLHNQGLGLFDENVPSEAHYKYAKIYTDMCHLDGATIHLPDLYHLTYDRECKVNMMCYEGAHNKYDHATRRWTHHIQNTGHWGDTYPGCGQVRAGQMKYLRRKDGVFI